MVDLPIVVGDLVGVRARFAVADYIEMFYNQQRLHSTLGYRTPVEVLTDYEQRQAA